MYKVIIASIVAFVSTEIDDFVSLMILMAEAQRKKDSALIIAGKFLGLAILCLSSALLSTYISKIPSRFVGLLGIILIVIGVSKLFKSKNRKSIKKTQTENETEDAASENESAENESTGPESLMLLGTTLLVTLSSGFDNLAVYIPFFTTLSGWEFAVLAAVFVILQGAMCALTIFIMNLKAVSSLVNRTRSVLIPVLFILLGLYIMFENGTLAWIFQFVKEAML